MQAPAFISLETTFEKAMYYRDSADYIEQALYFGGVQLLPNNQNPYRQRTYTREGIELEDPQVLVKDMCGNTLADITDYFTILENYNDSTGTPQIDWALTNVPFDFGLQLVYLEIQQLPAGETYYSTPFMLSADEAEYTSRWDYTNDLEDTVLSTQLRCYFKQYDDAEELTSFTPVRTGRQLSFSNTTPFEVWQTAIVHLDFFKLFKQMRQCLYVYCDYCRAMPYETLETPRRAGGENFGEAQFTITRDEGDTYDPLYIPVVPPPPPPPEYEIILESVNAPNNYSVIYTFSVVGFEPSYLQYQYSADGVTWGENTSTGSPASPHTVNVPTPYDSNWYFRIYYPPLDVASNVLQLPVPELVLNNITGVGPFQQNGNKYLAYFTANGFTVTQTVIPLVSTDGVTWINGLFGANNDNPKDFSTPSGSQQFTYFRLKYSPLNLFSNVLEYQL